VFAQLWQAVAPCQARREQEDSVLLRLHCQSPESSLALPQSSLWSVSPATTPTTDPATTSRHTSAFPDHATAGQSHPAATAIPTTAPTTLTAGPAISTEPTPVVLVHAVGLNQTITATSLLARSTVTAVPAISIKLKSEVGAHVLMALNQTTATVTLRPVLITPILVLAISTRSTLLITTRARESDQVVIAITLAPVPCTVGSAMSIKHTSEFLARVLTELNRPPATVILFSVTITHIAEAVISIERTWEVLARVLVGLSHPLATVISIPVLITHTLVLATSTENTLVVPVHAVELDQTITATTPLLALVTCTVVRAMTTERTSEVLARVLVGLNRPPATVTLLPVPITHMLVLVIVTRSTLVVLLHALESDQAVIAIIVRAQVTCIVEPAMGTEGTSAVTATATE